MKKIYSILLAGLLLCNSIVSLAQMVGDNVFLPGHYLEIGLSPNGSLGSTVAVPASYFPNPGTAVYADPVACTTPTIGLGAIYDYGFDGYTVGGPAKFGDYTMQGSPWEGWAIEVGGIQQNAWYTSLACGVYFTSTGTGTMTGLTSGYSVIPGSCGAPTTLNGYWNGNYAGLNVAQNTRLDTNGSCVIFTVVIKNITGAAINNIYYMRSVDPDNDQSISGLFQTNNAIQYNEPLAGTGNRAMVTSQGTAFANCYLALCARDCRAHAFIAENWPLYSGNIADQYFASFPGTSSGTSTTGFSNVYTQGASDNGDFAIGLVYQIATLAAGDSTFISYAYTFDAGTGAGVPFDVAPGLKESIDSAFPGPEMMVNCAGPFKSDTINLCTYTGGSTVSVNIINGQDRDWTWSNWTWSPAIGLSTTSGVTNTINTSLLTGLYTTYTIVGTTSSKGSSCPVHDTFYVTINRCTGVYANTPCLGDTLKLTYVGSSSVTTTYLWIGPGGFTSTLQDPFIAPTVYPDTGIYHLTTSVSGVPTGTYTLDAHVNPNPLPITISGVDTICSSALISLYDFTTGGSWSLTNTTGYLYFGTTQGYVGMLTYGTDTAIYTLPTGCRDSFVVHFDTLTIAAPITGSATVCVGGTDTLRDATAGGVWTASNGTATITGTGIITGIRTGTDTVIYSLSSYCGISNDTFIVNVVQVIAPITGNLTVCQGNNDTLYDTTPGVTWSTGSSGIATIGAITGVVTGVAGGTAAITCGGTGGCYATATLTVNPMPTPILGSSTVCAGTTITLNDFTPGGVWTALTGNVIVTLIGPAAATITGVTAGSTLISYTTPGGCYVIFPMSVLPAAVLSSITGASVICPGALDTMIESVGGGVWSSSNTGVATVSPTGIVTAIGTGTTTITDILTNSCGTADSTFTISVSNTASAGTISGTDSVCIGSTVWLTDPVGGGTWSSTNTTVATINVSGHVSGHTAGLTTIIYSVTTSCGTATTSVSVKVLPTPTVSAITGTFTVCPGANTSLADATAGGVWTISNGNASVTATGIVTGIATGTDTVIYSYTTVCGTATTSAVVTIEPLPNAGIITGSSPMCSGSVATYTDVISGGTWSSSNTAVAGITSGGIVTAGMAGSTVITYSVSQICGTAAVTATLTVVSLPSAGTIVGSSTVCAGSTITLNDFTAGGTWTASNAHATVTLVGPAAATVTGNTGGLDTIHYTVVTSCGTADTFMVITVNTLANPGVITGSATTLCTGVSVTLTDPAAGGVWSSTNTVVATVTPVGTSSVVVNPLTVGTTTISYTTSSVCGFSSATVAITVNASADAGSITGSATVCVGNTTTLGDGIPGGTWSVSNGHATVSALGVVTGISGGIDTIHYTQVTSCGTADTFFYMTVNTLANPGVITGITTLCTGSPVTYTDPASGGVWSSTNPGVATVTTIGAGTAVINPLSAGTTIISYTTSSPCGFSAATADVIVNDTPQAGTISGAGSTVCIGSGLSLSETSPGGTWSTTNGNANISSSGLLVGFATGLDTVKYTVSTVCGTAVASYPVTIIGVAGTGAITGASHTICTAVPETLTDTAAGGVWQSSNSTIAVVSSSGVVTGISAGSAIISYVKSGTCGSSIATFPITVNLSPNAGVIAGGSSTCVGSVLVLSDLTSGGIWSSSDMTIATVVAAGVTGDVTGVSSGTVVISYVVTNSCGTAIATTTVTVTPTIGAGVITGGSAVCIGSALSLSDLTGSGTWHSSNSLIASVNSSGVVTGVAVGTAIITYDVSSSCGFAIATQTVSVGTPPNAGHITGTPAVCTGITTTLVDTAHGGVWSSSNPAIATVNSSGVVTGVTAGMVNIYYTVAGSCGSTDATVSVTVSLAPVTGTISGPAVVCPGDNITLAETVGGGTWSSSNPLIATISSTGVVTGVSSGPVTISYNVTSSCGTVSSTDVVGVSSFPDAGVILGTPDVCLGSISVLSDTTPGGTWFSGNTAIATVGSTGIVTGVGVGTVNVYYSVSGACGTTNATVSVNVSNPPAASIISGITALCLGSTSSLTDTAHGGTWSSSDTAVATVTSTGVVTARGLGLATISYLIINSCSEALSVADITVIGTGGTAGTIAGATAICPGSTTTLSDSLSGGSWSSSNTLVATISSSGVVTSTASLGTTIISYVLTTSCGTGVSTSTLTVSTTPDAGTITGVPSVCLGLSETLSDPVSGGIWSSSNPAVAVVSSSGLLSGLTIGTTTISYSVTESCGTGIATSVISVSTSPYEGLIIGVTTMCAGSISSLTETVPGGVWSSGNPSVAVVSSTGVVTAISGGTDIVSYIVTGACGAALATADFSVDPTPVTGTITGSDSICLGGTTTLFDAAGADTGTWVSGNTAIATVNSAGVVTGLADGTAIIYYGLTNACGTHYSSVNMHVISTVPSSAGVIYGVSGICPGSNLTLGETIPGGSWSTSNPSIATINSLGVITGVSGGTFIVTYTMSDACGSIYTTKIASVTPTPTAGTLGAVTTNVCPGDSVIFTDGVTGGTWSSSDNTIATVSSTGGVMGVAAGSATISYIVSNICGVAIAAAGVNVNPAPVVTGISGPTSMCNGSTINVVDFTFGGTWSVSNTTVATIDAAGDVFSSSPGVDTIYYFVTNIFGCSAGTSFVETVNPSPVANPIGAYTTVVCAGSTITLTETATDGAWSTTDPTIATITTTGVVTGIAAGTVAISYTASNTWCTVTASTIVYVNPIPAVGPITGAAHICAGTVTSLSNLIFGGTWASSNDAIAIVDTFTGVLTGIAAGVDTIYYVNTNIFGCSATTSYVDTVSAMPSAGSISAVTTTVCMGSSISLIDGVSGGVWSSSDVTIATVTSGNVTGIAAGTANITYAVASGYCTATSIVTINVNPVPVVGAIAGATNICISTSTSLTDAVYGGVWRSSNTTIETVDASSGVAYGNAVGMDTIYYTVTNVQGCSTTVNATDTVSGLPVVAGIMGAANVCLGATTSLTDATGGGVWSSNDTTIASVATTGVVTGTGLGNTTIYYTVTNGIGCTASNNMKINVNPNPGVGPITGASSLCSGTATTLSDDSIGGVWSSMDTTIATIDNTLGTVIGRTAGVDSITYTVYNIYGCSASITTAETINPTPVVGTINGATITCLGSTANLTDTTAGGSWTSSNATIAPIDATGTVSGYSLGVVIISYSFTNSFGCEASVFMYDTVASTPVVSALSGATHVCQGGGILLTDPSSGGVWSSSDTSIARVSTSGLVTGVAVGETTIMYTITNTAGCSSYTTQVDSVIAAPTVLPISGASVLCPGSTTTLTDGTASGSWTSSTNTVATITTGGVLSGVATGVDTIGYSVVNSAGCAGSAVLIVNVDTLPTSAIVPSAGGSICHGNPVTLVVSSLGSGLDYQWYFDGRAITGATNDSYAADSAGNYTVNISLGACNETLTGVTIYPQPTPTVSLSGATLLTDTFSTYQWLFNGGIISGANSISYTESASGNYQVIVTDRFGCRDTSAVYAIFPLGVGNVQTGMSVKLYPNPATSAIHIDAAEDVNVTVTAMDGKILMTVKATNDVDVSTLANGVYMFMVYDKNDVLLLTSKVVKTE